MIISTFFLLLLLLAHHNLPDLTGHSNVLLLILKGEITRVPNADDEDGSGDGVGVGVGNDGQMLFSLYLSYIPQTFHASM